MDYSKLSDFEINKLVENIVRPGWQESDYRVPNSYCSNPADAWPIIVSHRIGLNFVNGAWRAQSMVRGYDECVHDNPLRAAMLVYLQLQEAK